MSLAADGIHRTGSGRNTVTGRGLDGHRRFREPEVQQLGARLCKHDVAGFQIAVNNAVAVGLV